MQAGSERTGHSPLLFDSPPGGVATTGTGDLIAPWRRPVNTVPTTHQLAYGWADDNGHGVACACGTAFDGFASAREAGDQLDQHVADKTAVPSSCPSWCIEHESPDPGVWDHYSREWSGGSSFDRDAQWSLNVTVRVTDGVAGPAVVDVHNVSGSFVSTAGLVAALVEAQRMIGAAGPVTTDDGLLFSREVDSPRVPVPDGVEVEHFTGRG